MEKLLWKEKLSYGIGAYGKDFIYNMIAAFLMIFYTDVVGVSLIFVSTLFLVVRIVDAITNPFMGWLVDNTNNKFFCFNSIIFKSSNFFTRNFDKCLVYCYISVMESYIYIDGRTFLGNDTGIFK